MNWSEIFKTLFPDGITADFIASVLVCIVTLCISIGSTSIKKKISVQDIQKSNSEKASAASQEKSQEAINAVNVLSNMLLTIFLNANTLDAETKKQLVSYGKLLESIADINLTDEVKNALDVVEKFAPESTIVEKREQLEQATVKVEEALDQISDATSSLIDKIKLGD